MQLSDQAVVLAYLATALTLGTRWFGARRASGRLETPALLVAGLLLVLLGLMRWLDAAPLLVGKMRDLTFRNGLYDYHRLFQLGAIMAILGSGATTGWLFRLHLRNGRRAMWGGAAFFALLLWVLARASSLHVADALMGIRLGPLTVFHVGELLCLACLATAILWPHPTSHSLD